PPKFVNSAQQLQRGSRGYKDINLLAMKLLKQNGILITFSCSGHLSPELFQKIVADAALDAGREAGIIQYLGQSSDHPVALNFPEGRYLKGLICHVC
ncbi:MAG: 23S rRNA methyltransferase, partial [Gammaproteobacteria bacterium]|nr:23S rRNA methyltransferase [Gammaproteobacteria bacterium]